MKTTDTIARTGKTLEERGLPADSFFEVWFRDGSHATEIEIAWSSISEERRVRYFEGTKTVFVSTRPVARIRMRHGDLVADCDVPEGCEAYQSVRSETILMNGKTEHRVVGRSIGIVKDGEVIEEQFLNGVEGGVFGTKK